MKATQGIRGKYFQDPHARGLFKNVSWDDLASRRAYEATWFTMHTESAGEPESILAQNNMKDRKLGVEGVQAGRIE